MADLQKVRAVVEPITERLLSRCCSIAAERGGCLPQDPPPGGGCAGTQLPHKLLGEPLIQGRLRDEQKEGIQGERRRGGKWYWRSSCEY